MVLEQTVLDDRIPTKPSATEIVISWCLAFGAIAALAVIWRLIALL